MKTRKSSDGFEYEVVSCQCCAGTGEHLGRRVVRIDEATHREWERSCERSCEIAHPFFETYNRYDIVGKSIVALVLFIVLVAGPLYPNVVADYQDSYLFGALGMIGIGMGLISFGTYVEGKLRRRRRTELEEEFSALQGLDLLRKDSYVVVPPEVPNL